MSRTLISHIEAKLAQALQTTHLATIDNSWKHAGHVGNIMGGSHLAITIVSPLFEGMPTMQRHRTVRDLLKEEMAGPVHALELSTLTPSQWNAHLQPS